jgi:hypothetical protein
VPLVNKACSAGGVEVFAVSLELYLMWINCPLLGLWVSLFSCHFMRNDYAEFLLKKGGATV